MQDVCLLVKPNQLSCWQFVHRAEYLLDQVISKGKLVVWPNFESGRRVGGGLFEQLFSHRQRKVNGRGSSSMPGCVVEDKIPYILESNPH